uniref:Protein regulator of cytokinesis 1 n=1 Tax=Glossina pallidipes TaxID=7398 RepID=A0A1A9Z4W8_GLOPL
MMSNKYNNAIENMQEKTKQYLTTLTEIWTKMFDEESCKENLNKVLVHSSDFYEDLVQQFLTKRSCIEKDIDELKEEIKKIRRLLKVEVNLPHGITDTTPLTVIHYELDRILDDLREQLAERRALVCELLAEQALLCDELGEPPRPLLSDPLPTPSEMEDFRRHVDNLYSEKQKLEKKLSTMRRDIKKFLDILKCKLRTEMEEKLLHSRHIKLNKETFENLQHMYDLYGGQVQELKDNIDDIRKKLDTLWEHLGTSPNTRSKFRQYTDYNQHTYDIMYSELLRCETLKNQNIKMYVEQLRDEIRDWWDKTLNTCYTDDLLMLHELELEDLKLYYENNRQLFELYADRNILWDRMQALEAKASEPGRYNNRGGQLLKEEKERKTIDTKLPKIERQIQQLVQNTTCYSTKANLWYNRFIVSKSSGLLFLPPLITSYHHGTILVFLIFADIPAPLRGADCGILRCMHAGIIDGIASGGGGKGRAPRRINGGGGACPPNGGGIGGPFRHIGGIGGSMSGWNSCGGGIGGPIGPIIPRGP